MIWVKVIIDNYIQNKMSSNPEKKFVRNVDNLPNLISLSHQSNSGYPIKIILNNYQ